MRAFIVFEILILERKLAGKWVKTYYLTTAIAYTSGKPHIGNTYEAILADSIVRFKRQQGYDVRFQTGTDEHGQKIELKGCGSRNYTKRNL